MEEEADILTFSREDATNQVSSKTKKLTGRINSAKKKGNVRAMNSKNCGVKRTFKTRTNLGLRIG